MNNGEKKVLVIHGSPRKDGNTDILLGEAVRGIRETNKYMQVEEIFLSDIQVTPCKECRACDKTGRCVIKDDMQSIYSGLTSCDYVVLGSPIFFYSVTAWAKAMIDRTQALWAKKYLVRESVSKKKKEERGGWFVSVGATRGERLFQGAILTAKYFFDTIDVPYRGDLLVRGVDEKDEIRNHREVLSKAYNLGVEIGLYSKK